ncbi:MAG: SPFH/Band 7/PHB domain protein [Nitrospirae bacterium]|nr:SPFH/Band 7/PHB domain protein [Nitrospirota bacterium]
MLGAVFIFFTAVIFVFIAMSVKIVPQQSAFVIERLGSYNGTLNSGLSFVVPFIDRIAYRHTLKEQVIDVPEQVCITKDNVQMTVDGVVFIQVMNPQQASYGISSYNIAIIQLAQTTMRSQMGKLDLDKTFEERENVNKMIVAAVDEAAHKWGVKTLRYEIKNITPPTSVLHAMEKQMAAEREKRALILKSEGEKQSAINIAEGDKQKAILQSEGEMAKKINEAKGEGEAIKLVADATAEGIKRVAAAVSEKGGLEAVQYRVASNLVNQFGNIAKAGNTMIVPASMSDISSVVTTAMNVIKSQQTSAAEQG